MSNWTFHPPPARIVTLTDLPRFSICPRCGCAILSGMADSHKCMHGALPVGLNTVPWQVEDVAQEAPEIARMREIGRAAREEMDRIARQAGLQLWR